MPAVNYYLKKPEINSTGALIYLQFKYNGRKLVYSFGQKINPVDWSKDRKRVKSNRETILNGQYALNDLLDELEDTCLQVYQEELVNGVPPVSVLQFRLNSFIRHKQGKEDSPALYHLFDRFISGEIKHKSKARSANTLKNYAATRSHLNKFDIHSRYHLCFENINLDFYRRYTSFLRDELKLKTNSIARDISVVKTVMNEAVDSGYTTNIQWRHKQFSYASEETEVVCLSEKEIISLFRHDLSANRRLEQIRDLFVFASLTGMSYAQCAGMRTSDYVRQSHPEIYEILQKYESRLNGLPKAPSNQKFNEYIKECCQLAGFIEKGRLSSSPDTELWQCISSVTARRSFAANSYKVGFPVPDLMKITGHSTERALMRFIRVA